MKKLITATALFLFLGMANKSYSQSIYTDVYNAYQKLNGNESKTVETDKNEIEYTKEKQDAEENLYRQRERDSYEAKEEKKTETDSDPE